MIKWSRLVTFILVTVVVFTAVGLSGLKVAQGITLGLDLRGGFEVLYEVSPLNENEEINKKSLTDAVKAIERRINILGVAEPEIVVEGNDRIRVRLAGAYNQEEARELIGKPAKLTFRDMQGNILMDGNDLATNGAALGYNEMQQPVVNLKFKDAKKFAEVTKKHLYQPLAIYMDENLITAPTINSVIPGGSAYIDGQESIQAAKDLAALLNAGALPVEMKEVYSNSVGAKLGQTALENGVKAGIIGTIIVLVFMIIFYRMPGVVAVISLVAYVYLLLLFQNLMQATLTLPGIAAFILGIGMAVDANIIMYERIKEELRKGKSILSAVRSGSKRSLSTILDANVTSIIGAIVLFYFGSSAIRGFAIILILSIVVSMLTAVAGSRFLLNLLVKSNLFNKLWHYGVRERDVREL